MAEGAAAQGSARALCPCLSCWSSGAVPGQREPGDTLSFGFILALQHSELMRPASQHLLVFFSALFSDRTLLLALKEHLTALVQFHLEMELLLHSM